jgi:hypothetical protein
LNNIFAVKELRQMDSIILNKEKIFLKFSKDELLLLCNSLNEVCNGIEVPEFDSRIGASIEETEIILKFLGRSFEKNKQCRLDEMRDL